MRRLIVPILILVLSLSAVSAYAQQRPSVGLGIGFTLDPETFLFGGNFHYPLVSNLSLGPLVQVGVSDEDTLIGISGNFKYSFILAEVPRLVPSVEAGAGVLVIDEDSAGDGDDDSDTSFLLVLGGGADYMITNNFGVGSHVYFNPAPGPGDDFFFSWFFGIVFNL